MWRFQKADTIKEQGFFQDNVSVDCSTFINRSIDGNKRGTAQSGYFDYNTRRLIRIMPENKNIILKMHSEMDYTLYHVEEIEEIIDIIIEHQNGFSSIETYEARAKLMFHNADVFRYNIEDNKPD